MDIDFIKAEGAGNDFIIVDSENLASFDNIGRLAKVLCSRKRSIGADGLLIFDASKSCDFKMRIFNPDGQEVSMCGNGARCLSLYAHQKKGLKSNLCLETRAGFLQTEVNGNIIRLKMPEPESIKMDFILKIDNKKIKVDFINCGVPHVVCFVDNVDNYDVVGIGRKIRYHKEFQPEGTNADFIEILNERSIKLRVYERGVEDETLSCGTGAVASSLIAAKKGKVNPPVNVQTRSGQILKIYFDIVGDLFKNIYLEGECNLVYEGKVNI